jgi:hypothetical protein
MLDDARRAPITRQPTLKDLLQNFRSSGVPFSMTYVQGAYGVDLTFSGRTRLPYSVALPYMSVLCSEYIACIFGTKYIGWGSCL